MNDPDQMASAICAILADPARARRLGLAGRTRVVAHFTIDHTARRVQAVYDELLAPGDQPASLPASPMLRPPFPFP